MEQTGYESFRHRLPPHPIALTRLKSIGDNVQDIVHRNNGHNIVHSQL